MVSYCYLVIGNWVGYGDIIIFYVDVMFIEINVYYGFKIGIIQVGICFGL